MMPWFKIKKREGNAVWYGTDLGAERPKVEAIIVPETASKIMPKRFQRKIFFPKGDNVSKQV